MEDVFGKDLFEDMENCSEAFWEDIYALYEPASEIFQLLQSTYMEESLKETCHGYLEEYRKLRPYVLGDLVHELLGIVPELKCNQEEYYEAMDKLYSELIRRGLDLAGEDHVEICRVLGERLLLRGNEAKCKHRYSEADQFYVRAMLYDCRSAFLERGDLYINCGYLSQYKRGVETLRDLDILCLKKDFVCQPEGVNESFDRVCRLHGENQLADCEDEIFELYEMLEDEDPLKGPVCYNLAILNLANLAENSVDCAVDYLKTAAEYKVEEAALLLAVLYYEGVECGLNDEEAYEYLLRGYKLNQGVAGKYRSECFTTGRGIEKNEQKAMDYDSIYKGHYTLIAKNGNKR